MEESLAKSTLNIKEGDISLLNENTESVAMINVTELPSEFKGYPEGTKISYKPLTFEEIDALNSADVDPARAVAMLLKAIHCTTLPSEELYYWDVMYIGIRRKLLAFGDTRGTLYARCPKCGNIVSKSFNYTELDFKTITAPALPMRMDVCGRKVDFSVLTMKDFLQIEIGQGELGIYARMMKNIPFEEAYEMVKKSTGTDIKKIRFADKQLDYGIKPFFVECEGEENGVGCGEKVIVEVRSPFEVVFPQDETDGLDEFEVQYG